MKIKYGKTIAFLHDLALYGATEIDFVGSKCVQKCNDYCSIAKDSKSQEIIKNHYSARCVQFSSQQNHNAVSQTYLHLCVCIIYIYINNFESSAIVATAYKMR